MRRHLRSPRIAASLAAVAVALLGSISPGAAPPSAVAAEWTGAVVHPMHFPVEGPARFRADFGDPRSGGRTHKGNDIFGEKLQHVVAANDGTVVRVARHAGISGHYLVIREPSGWEHLYIHLNDDTPGTDDGAGGDRWAFAPGITVGAKVRAGQHVGYLGDSGNAEGEAPHLHYELHTPAGTAIDPWDSLRQARGIHPETRCGVDRNPARPAGADEGDARAWLAAADGGVFAVGGAPYLGSLGDVRLNRPVVGAAARPQGDGYWLVADDGGVFAFGEARFHGSLGDVELNRPIVGGAATPSGEGYWLVASDGGVFAFGDAAFHGSTGGQRLNRPVVGMAPTSDGAGYRLVASDGGVFTFGTATFHGSTGGQRLVAPIVGISTEAPGDDSPGDAGYRLVALDAGVFAFGAVWHGSVPAAGRCRWATAAGAAAPAGGGDGYLVAGTDGSVEAFGWAAEPEGVAGSPLAAPVVAIATPAATAGGPTA